MVSLFTPPLRHVAQAVFSDLVWIFARYAGSVGGSRSAADALEISSSELKSLVTDAGSKYEYKHMCRYK